MVADREEPIPIKKPYTFFWDMVMKAVAAPYLHSESRADRGDCSWRWDPDGLELSAR